jgi:HK97 family phage major capsid protein
MPEKEKKNQPGSESVNVTVDASDVIRKIEEAKNKPEIDEKEIAEKARKSELARIREISAIGEKFNQKDLAKDLIEKGESVEQMRVETMEKMGEIKAIDPKQNHIGLTEKQKGQFMIVRAVRALVENNWDLAPFEKECSDAVAKKLGKSAQGFFVPDDVLCHELGIDKRDLTVGTPTAGGNLVATDLLAASFIDLLRNKMVVRQMGATILSGLVGNVAIPRQTGAATAYWVTEGNAPTESQQAFDQVTMTPKTVGAFTDISRKLIIQSSVGIEALVRNDLAKVTAIEIDRAAINGSGSGAEPTGILNTSGIGNVGTSPGVPTYAQVIELWSDIAAENADFGDLGYLTNPLVCAKLMQTFTNTTYGEVPVWMGGPGDGSMIGYKAKVTNQIPSNLGSSTGASSGDQVLSAMIFANWADLLIGEWSGLDILIDPYTHSTSGTVRIVVLQDVDIAVRHPESFSAMKEIDVS